MSDWDQFTDEQKEEFLKERQQRNMEDEANRQEQKRKKQEEEAAYSADEPDIEWRDDTYEEERNVKSLREYVQCVETVLLTWEDEVMYEVLVEKYGARVRERVFVMLSAQGADWSKWEDKEWDEIEFPEKVNVYVKPNPKRRKMALKF
jgi:hypothetical protein